MSICNSEVKRILELETANLISINLRIERARAAAKEARCIAEGAVAYLNSLIELSLSTQEQIDRLEKITATTGKNTADTSSSSDELSSAEDEVSTKTTPTKVASSDEKKTASTGTTPVDDNKEVKYDSSNIICKFNDLCFYHPDNYQNKPALLFTDANPEFNTCLFYMCKFKHTKPPRSLCFNPKCEGTCNLLHAPTKHMWCKYSTTCLYAPENIKKVNNVSFTQKHICWKIHATEEFGFKKLCPQVFRNKCRNINCKYIHSDHLS